MQLVRKTWLGGDFSGEAQNVLHNQHLSVQLMFVYEFATDLLPPARWELWVLWAEPAVSGAGLGTFWAHTMESEGI